MEVENSTTNICNLVDAVRAKPIDNTDISAGACHPLPPSLVVPQYNIEQGNCHTDSPVCG